MVRERYIQEDKVFKATLLHPGSTFGHNPQRVVINYNINDIYHIVAQVGSNGGHSSRIKQDWFKLVHVQGNHSIDGC